MDILEKTVVDMINNMSEEVVESFKKKKEDELCQMHHGYGTHIRNKYRLWGGGELSDYFKSQGVRHPDNMSTKIIKAIWVKIQELK